MAAADRIRGRAPPDRTACELVRPAFEAKGRWLRRADPRALVSCRQVGHDAPGSWASSTTITANTIEARPRGPNQPRKPTVGIRAPVPIIAIATGSMRTSVRLSTA
jgi:hypothetical protein